MDSPFIFSRRNSQLNFVNSIVIGVQQKQPIVDMTLLEKRTTKFSGFEQDSNPRPWPFLTGAMIQGLKFDQGYRIFDQAIKFVHLLFQQAKYVILGTMF